MSITYNERTELAFTMGEIRAILDKELGVKRFLLKTMIDDLDGVFEDLDIPQLVNLGKVYQLGYKNTQQDDIAPKDTARMEDM